MLINNSSLEDIETIFKLYRSAVDYQKAKGYNLWPEFEQKLIEQEINEKRLWKITEAEEIACIFSVAYTDPIIWDENDADPAIYLHRITTNPLFKGKGMMQLIIDWSKEHAKQNNKKSIRMDTWGDNDNLKKYYTNCGFTYLRQKHFPGKNELPAHYWGNTLSLFEIKL